MMEPSPNTCALVSCQKCHQQTAIYACPRCRFRSCSLACCRAHKQATGCDGRRTVTAFQPLARMNDATLQSDYHFLETVLASMETGKRLIEEQGGNHQVGNKRPRRGPLVEEKAPPATKHTLLAPQSNVPAQGKWRAFQQAAAAAGVKVVFMPEGMARHRSNRSSVKKGALYWTVEIAVHKEDRTQGPIRRLVHGVDPEKTLTSIVGGELGSQSLLIRRLPCPSNQPNYVKLSNDATLATALRYMTVIEYPTIEVVPDSCLEDFHRAIEDVT